MDMDQSSNLFVRYLYEHKDEKDRVIIRFTNNGPDDKMIIFYDNGRVKKGELSRFIEYEKKKNSEVPFIELCSQFIPLYLKTISSNVKMEIEIHETVETIKFKFSDGRYCYLFDRTGIMEKMDSLRGLGLK